MKPRMGRALLALMAMLMTSGCTADNGATVTSPAGGSTGNDSACSLAFVVSYRQVEYQAALVLRTRPFTHTRAHGMGTLATCHPEDAARTLSVSAIDGVDTSIALATPQFPRLVFLSVPLARAPRSIKPHLRFPSSGG